MSVISGKEEHSSSKKLMKWGADQLGAVQRHRTEFYRIT